MNFICMDRGHDHTARAGDRLICVRCGRPEEQAPVRRYDALAFRQSHVPINPKTIT